MATHPKLADEMGLNTLLILDKVMASVTSGVRCVQEQELPGLHGKNNRGMP